MPETTYNVIQPDKGVPIKAWTKGVTLEDEARKQLLNAAQLPFIFKWIAAMPDVHWGIGATVGSVIPTKGAIIPAAVGVDIGCGMMAVRTSLNARDLPDNLNGIRAAIENAVPHGRTKKSNSGCRTLGWKATETRKPAWQVTPSQSGLELKNPALNQEHLGTQTKVVSQSADLLH